MRTTQVTPQSTLRWTLLVAAGSLAACEHNAPKPVSPELPQSRAAVSLATPLAIADVRQTPTAEQPPVAAAGPLREAGGGTADLHWTVPEGWMVETPSSGMRKAQYRVPGPGGDAECLVFNFGPGQGGDPMSNAQRWASQFQTADGSDAGSALKTRETTAGGIGVLMVEVAGTYVGGMGGSATSEKPDYALLGAIAKSSDSNWFFKLTGPEKTVLAQRGAFEGLIRTLKKGA
jgi:hypothetical protein